MKCTTSRFGTFDIAEDAVLSFPSGLLGFPEERRYVMLDHDTEVPFKWLQSLDNPELAFVVIDPLLFHADYRVELPAEAVAEVEGGESDDLTLTVILTIPSSDPLRITANLRGPLLMNPRTKLCKQLVLSDDFPTRHPLFSVNPADETSAERTLPTAACPA